MWGRERKWEGRKENVREGKKVGGRKRMWEGGKERGSLRKDRGNEKVKGTKTEGGTERKRWKE